MRSPATTKHITAANRNQWDASAKYHEQSDQWSALKLGFAEKSYSVLDNIVSAALTSAGVDGAKLVQIGCNNGREILSTFSLGARWGLGLDQSQQFLQQAQTLQAISGHNCQFLCRDIYALPNNIEQDFDIALITIGVLNWMPDLIRFFEIAAGLLRPDGHMLVYETHPFLEMFDPESTTPHTPTFSYFKTQPHVESGLITYDGEKIANPGKSYWFPHQLGAIVSAITAAGLQIAKLEEFPHSIREVEYDIFAGRSAQLPMSYLLQARKP